MLPLRELQRSMYTFITEPGSTEQALAAAGPDLAERHVLPSATLSPLERLQIYRRMYLLRMGEALAADYPALQLHLGEAGFAELVAAYVERYPSRSYTLDRLGDQLVSFLSGDRRWSRLLTRDLARAEWTLVQVQEAPDSPRLEPARLAGLSAEQWERACLVPIAALRLVELSYPIHRLLSAVRREESLPALQRRRTYLLVWRQGHQLWRQPLEPRVARLLGGLLEGLPLGSALARAGRFSQQKLFQTFQSFMQDGLFSELRDSTDRA